MKRGEELRSAIGTLGGVIAEYDEDGPVFGGTAQIKSNVGGQRLRVIFSSASDWDHVSVSVWRGDQSVRAPSYTEMVRVKRAFFQPDETAMELHVPPSEHINKNPHVLHLWRPLDQDIPRPPAWMV